jgi:hypothetical protein
MLQQIDVHQFWIKKMIDQKTLKDFLLYDKKTGVFTWKFTRKKALKNSMAGCVDINKYIKIMLNGKNYSAHRLAWLYVYGVHPKGQIDHINCNKADNRIANLRDVPAAINMQNKIIALSSNKSTGLLGVTFCKRRMLYMAQIRINGKKKTLGYYDDPDYAHQVYLSAKRQNHEGCTI